MQALGFFILTLNTAGKYLLKVNYKDTKRTSTFVHWEWSTIHNNNNNNNNHKKIIVEIYYIKVTINSK